MDSLVIHLPDHPSIRLSTHPFIYGALIGKKIYFVNIGEHVYMVFFLIQPSFKILLTDIDIMAKLLAYEIYLYILLFMLRWNVLIWGNQ